MSRKEYSFIEVCDIQGGTQPPKDEFVYEKKDGYIRLLQIQDFKREDKTVYIKDRHTLKKCNDDDILIGRYGASIGKILSGLSGAYNVALVKAIPDLKKINKRFLWHFLNSVVFQEFIKNVSTRAAQAGFNKDDLAKLKIYLPSLNEQVKIASVLDLSDAIRKKREQTIKLADDFLRATFLEMFGDPVENPKKFKKSPITELADVITGFAFKSNEYISDSSEAVRLCRGANTLTGYLDWADTKFWPKNKLEKLDNYLIKAGDIILAMDRPWISSGLKVCIFPENQRETYLVQRVARLRPRCESYTNYIYSCIKSPAFEKHCCPTETTVPHISPVELKNFEVLIPPDELMVNFHSIVSIINNSLNKMASGDIDSDALFSKLSQQAFSGHLKR
ncbi:restriction endonuclease subunit S [Escherichia coli]|uniref:restriction endonuclease subunit S n=1 Tax=unclassified Escherichia TaxID=2608889 RepID=UPI000CF75D45|nr:MULTISPECIES: restriction endonuclease subunit S [unclassified Escherichia]EGO8359375.1 restriction endonuclease subunit S [Escherichia coli]MXC83272.1 restriction endonuclease subunit S [Escherichia sp. HH26CH]EGO8377715.1 restriction endonuclease subunit S [Escherichia coli]EGO8682870.1 restriction endonuclease subunit S [Escherichia coli]EGO8722474.1 restriction endonuclease subunit S [Escherichia coli]